MTTSTYGTSDGWIHAMDIADGRIDSEFETDGSKANASHYIDDKRAHEAGDALSRTQRSTA